MSDDEYRPTSYYPTQFFMGVLSLAAFFGGVVILSGDGAERLGSSIGQALLIGGVVGAFLALTAVAIERALRE